MSKLIVGNISSLNPPTDNTVTVDASSRLTTKAEVRLNGQSYHPLPIPTVPNYFAQKFNPVDLYRGAIDPDGNVVKQPFANSIQSGRGTSSRDATVTDSPVGGVPLRIDVTQANAFNTDWNNDDANIARTKAGETWIFSIYVKASAAAECELLVFGSEGGNGFEEYIGDGIQQTVTTGWTRISQTFSMSDAQTKFIRVRIDPLTPNVTYWFDGAMVEKTTFGNTTPSAWSGSAKPVVHPLVLETGILQYNTASNRLEVVDNNNRLIDSVAPLPRDDNPIGSFGNGGGFTVAEGAVNTNVINHTNGGMMTFQANIRRNGAPTGDESNSDTPNLRHPLEYVTSTSSNDFSMHTGHSPTPWPQFYAIKVSNDTYGRVLNRIRWYKHTNAVGNVNIWGSNQDIDRTNFTDTANFWTYITRQHFGGSGSGSEGGQLSRPFTNTYGYRWYLLEMVDNNSSALAYPSVGSQGGWAMYALTFDKT